MNIFQLNFPELKPSFDKIIFSIKNYVIKNYRKNEDNLRIYYRDRELFEKETKKYFIELDLFDNYIFHLLLKEKDLSKIFYNNSKENEKRIKLLMDDYYIIFLNYNLNNKKEKNENIMITYNIDKNKQFLSLIINIRNKIIKKYSKEKERDEIFIKKLSKIVNWTQSYCEEIILLEQIFSKLYFFIPELYELTEELVNKNIICYEISSNDLNNFPLINETFFIIINSILRIINSKEKIYDIPLNDLFKLIITIKQIFNDILQLEKTLNLYSKEIITLKEILKLIDLFSFYNKINVENIKKIIKYFSFQIDDNNNIEELCKNFNEFYSLLIIMIIIIKL